MLLLVTQKQPADPEGGVGGGFYTAQFCFNKHRVMAQVTKAVMHRNLQQNVDNVQQHDMLNRVEHTKPLIISYISYIHRISVAK